MKFSWSSLEIITLLCAQLILHIGGERFEPRQRLTTDGLKKIENFRATGISETNVTLQWDPSSSTNGSIQYKVTVKVDKFLGCSDRNESSPSKEDMRMVPKPEAIFARLHPYTNYTTTVIACIGGLEEIKGELNFTTDQRDIPTETVQNLRYEEGDEVLKWDAPECADMTGPWAETRLSFSEEAQEIRSERVPSNKFQTDSTIVADLGSYKTYKVRAYIVRSTEASSDGAAQSRKISFTTPASPPGKVDEMGSFDVNVEKRTVSLWWNLPFPLNGEVESYHLKIYQQRDDAPLLDETYETPAQVSKCKLSEKSVCLENVELRTNFSVQLDAQIRAKNKDVSSLGLVATHIVLESDWRTAELTRPEHLDQIIGDDGIVTVMWKHPPLPKFKITRFEVKAELLESTLLNTNSKRQNTTTANYPVKQEQKTYNTSLRLRTSSTYQIVVTATNEKNPSSGIVDSYNITIPFKPGFASGEIPRAECKGSDIEVVIPALVNATQDTTVYVVVELQLDGSKLEIFKDNYDVNASMPRYFTIRDTQVGNCSKHPEYIYNVIVKATDELSGQNITLPTSGRESHESKSSNRSDLLLIIMIPSVITAILLTIALFCYRRYKRSPRRANYSDNSEYSSMISRTDHLGYSRNETSPPLPPTKPTKRISNPVYAVPFGEKSSNVSMMCFEEYTRKAVFNGALNSQYALFPKGLKRPCEYGRLPENMPKNRYKNLIPYDDTRVVLKKIPGDPYSDYINASYIQGYRNVKKYIATQGPKANTVNDFWRMIWQERVSVICMLTNVTEGEKVKCELYWPEIGTEKKYGDIKVSNKHHKVFADYTFRYFVLSCEKKTRQVTHLHYTGWPDHGVPTYTGSLVAYLKKLMKTQTDNAPVVVHCSAGDGRTGMIILCDICLNQIICDTMIDVPGVIIQMRNNRANMVGSKQQYLLAHIIITESIVYLPTQVPCADVLTNKMKQLRERLPYDFRRLNDTQWQIDALQSLAAPVSLGMQNSGRNKESLMGAGKSTMRQNAVQYQRYSTIDCESNETETFGVDGVKMKNQFLASRIPSVTTIPEYWRYIAEKEIELIIILQTPNPRDPTHVDILPGDSILVPLPYIQVSIKSRLEEEHFTTDKLLLTDTSEEKARLQSVTVLTCTGWGGNKNSEPPDVAALISLWKASEKIQRKEGPTSVLCRDGVTGCGLYLALSFLLERMTVETVCDVISAVRAVRRSRPEFVESMEQFKYLYDAAVNYAQSFQDYANFS
ncbi:receptor-type tyrosine-protein phosphatase epsilon-like [Neodiprion pinetum]|uniref:receptor-type tyrosine-protein phosphatase epsilon-like n=1 Tax=Neodiprion pinetum TaxID=441929 RepID=UPI001EDE3251|nr:receptor-type tyrosine-protein phosphatase epsilon-like [Neodiprion pinetum]